MVALIILGILAAIIVLILLIPVGADLGYEQGRLHVSAKMGPILLQLFPRRPKSEKPEKKEKKKKPKKEKAPEEEKKEDKPKKERKLNFNSDEILELIRTALHSLGRFGRKLKVDRFVLHILAAGRDPYEVAVAFSYVNAALSSLAPLCRQRFTVKDCDVWTDVDFTREDMALDFGLAMTVRIGQILGMVLATGFGALRIFLRSKRRVKKEAKEAQREERNGIETNSSDNNQEVERMKANG